MKLDHEKQTIILENAEQAWEIFVIFNYVKCYKCVSLEKYQSQILQIVRKLFFDKRNYKETLSQNKFDCDFNLSLLGFFNYVISKEETVNKTNELEVDEIEISQRVTDTLSNKASQQIVDFMRLCVLELNDLLSITKFDLLGIKQDESILDQLLKQSEIIPSDKFLSIHNLASLFSCILNMLSRNTTLTKLYNSIDSDLYRSAYSELPLLMTIFDIIRTFNSSCSIFLNRQSDHLKIISILEFNLSSIIEMLKIDMDRVLSEKIESLDVTLMRRNN
jgi:hypothetical protein